MNFWPLAWVRERRRLFLSRTLRSLTSAFSRARKTRFAKGRIFSGGLREAEESKGRSFKKGIADGPKVGVAERVAEDVAVSVGSMVGEREGTTEGVGEGDSLLGEGEGSICVGLIEVEGTGVLEGCWVGVAEGSTIAVGVAGGLVEATVGVEVGF